MTPDAKTSWQIATTPPERQAAALERICAQAAPADRAEQARRMLAMAGRGEVSLAGLLEARRGEQTHGVVWIQTQTGATASLWPPQVVAPDDEACADALLTAAVEWMQTRGVCLVQSLLVTDADRDAVRLCRHGFAHMADLLYLVSLTAQFPTAPLAGDLRFVSVTPEEQGRLAGVVERTYQGTLDCPSLNGVRPIEDVLAGYRATGVFDPQRWLIVQRHDEDIGCLLLADHPHENQWEIVYTGLTPAARGQGRGTTIARQAQWLARLAGRQRLVLAVDAANWPAIDMYAAAGFVAWDRRSVFLRIFPHVG